MVISLTCDRNETFGTFYRCAQSLFLYFILEEDKMNFMIQAILLVIGFIMLVKGADWFVEGASAIADRFGIPQIVIGLTIVAMGTSAPEAAISISAALKGNAALTIGNVIGSNIMNILLILGITAIITPLAIQKSTLRYEIPFVVVITGILLMLGIQGGKIERVDGIILIICFGIFLAYLFLMMKKGEAVLEEVELEDKNTSMFKLVLLTIVGAGLIVLGSDITVDSATELALMFGLSDRIIGLTIIAFGTSLPELITSVTAGMKEIGRAHV